MLGIDKRANAALLLRFGYRVQRQRRLARAFRPIDLDDSALGKAADAERNVERQRACRDGLDLDHLLVLAEPHDRAFAEGTLDLRKGGIQRLRFIHRLFLYKPQNILSHDISPLVRQWSPSIR